MKVDSAAAATVQFDVHRGKLTSEGGALFLGALLDEVSLRTAWLIPLTEISNVSRQSTEKLVIVASAKPDAADRCRPYRYDTLELIAQAVIEWLEAYA